VAGRIVIEANMGAISAIMSYGIHEQKKLASQLILDGDKPAICITEPEAGSCATSMTTRADENPDGSYRINGKKIWISGGGVSKLNLVFARVFDQAGEEQGIGGFIIVNDPNNPKLADRISGFKVSRLENTLGLRGMPEAELVLEDVIALPKDVLRTPNGFSKGFSDLMNAYNAQRVGAASCALGIAQGAYEMALAYSKTRTQFGRPICEFQGLQWMLADMSIQLEAARCLVYKAAASAGEDWESGVFPDPLQAAQAKIFAAETAIKVTNDALQIYGAAGYSKSNPMERYLRDARMFAIGGGTTQVLRNLVAAKLLHRRFKQTG
jgi:3-sulfinopropanoyl-CoA desulfinase